MIYFITPYPKGNAASQRFRFEQYFDLLTARGLHYEVHPFWNEKGWEVLYLKGKTLQKSLHLIKGIFRRWLLAFQMKQSDFAFIHREIYPTGTGLLVWYLSKVKKVPIIYDFDDAIWLPNYAATNKRYAFLKSYHQVPKLIKNAYKVSVGNDFLKAYALKFNTNVCINPTTIDTKGHHNKIKSYEGQDQLVIGWTGTHSTIKYLDDLLAVFDQLTAEGKNIKLLVISDLHPNFD